MKITYKQAQTTILNTLAGEGWEVRQYLKRPWAKDPLTGDQFFFRAQSIYLNENSLWSCPKAISQVKNISNCLRLLADHFTGRNRA